MSTEKNNKSIINVVVNGMKAIDTITEVKTRIEAVEKSTFNIALLASYGVGITIPEYTDNRGNIHGEAICDSKMKQKDYIKLVGRSKASISRWISAMKLIIENGYFTDFATGVYPFSYDKIIAILGTPEAFKDSGTFSELMSLSATTLEDIVKAYKTTSTSEEKTEEVSEEKSDNTDSETETDSKEEERAEEKQSEETAVLTYNGKDYTVNKAVFERWLAENATLA